MRVTGISLTAPASAKDNPVVTPELLAATLAKYSRSNKGVGAILAGVDPLNSDKAVEAIFKFVDYGHASIGGLTGGIAMAVDGVSMALIYKLFEFSQLADGQESSTRYIQMLPESLPDPEAVGIIGTHALRWRGLGERAFAVYNSLYEKLDVAARENPNVMRIPANTPPKWLICMRKNFALDRARYVIPFAVRSNAALVMSARMWADTIRKTEALGWTEAIQLAALMRTELQKYAPRLTKHSIADEASKAQAKQEDEYCREWIRSHGVGTTVVPDHVYASVEDSTPEFLPHIQNTAQGFEGKKNRYSLVGERIRRQFVRFAWNNISIAELRDLNRHRTGYRFSPLTPIGFYRPEVAEHPQLSSLLSEQADLIRDLASTSTAPGAYLYAYLLGVQTPFEHSTHADKFIYEVELRTGLGAHYRYAEHLAAAFQAYLKRFPEAKPFVEIGTAEPE